jgi:hypothetical protein
MQNGKEEMGKGKKKWERERKGKKKGKEERDTIKSAVFVSFGGSMGVLFGVPTLAKLFHGTHINNSVVQQRVKFWHVPNNNIKNNKNK